MSPLPEQLITIWVSFSRVGHNLFNQANAWDVSSAGIIPSSSLTSLKASKALDALRLVSELEGIIPALETSHAFAWLNKLCPTLEKDTHIVINCSGRGDKDVNTVASSLDI